MSEALPGRPGLKLTAIYERMNQEERTALRKALLDGSTPAEWLADLLRSNELDVSASTIRTYRRALRREGVASV
ncbi:helix-turn-helix DNA binding domain protein [Streptomyces phage RedBear]|nr:helix-turn-helix DNA binding domain protein [Streptomyces phage RedBear]QZE10744.1 helix-turn-helix DNA binding domain protein [Streptomyces phage Katalie]QZE11038.1 helix-turn-helix DNA binding domain protein [Streptomyces phage South40]